MLRRHTGKEHLICHHCLQICITHCIQLGPGDNPRVLPAHDADTTGDGLGSETIIAGDHHDADARLMTGVNRGSYLRTRWVHHGNQPEEGKFGLDFRLRVACGGAAAASNRRQGTTRHRQYPQSGAGIGVILRHDACPLVVIQGLQRARHTELCTQCEHLFRRTLDECHGLPSLLMEGAHAFATRFEGEFPHPRQLLQLGLELQTGFLRCYQQRRLGGVAQDRPARTIAIGRQ
ncbi:MAG: hypothetical protein BWY63_03761 [Chloroflexi bacterium ADurb.Bin360]|nr:MAG: hypothetical protein BWY63_03761 [Chloroflexi bacterium ADurb.Bin360]